MKSGYALILEEIRDRLAIQVIEIQSLIAKNQAEGEYLKSELGQARLSQRAVEELLAKRGKPAPQRRKKP